MSRRHLILIRHATAAAGTGRDFDRPLTRRGFVEAQRVGERLRVDGPVPDRVLCSSARRCRETWQSLATGLAADTLPAIDLVFDDRLYNASTAALIEAIQGEHDARVVLVLAHNPGISVLALELGRADAESAAALREGFAPASLAVFEIDDPWCELSPASARCLRFERLDRDDMG
jgi:phosphohistidine phosphatase